MHELTTNGAKYDALSVFGVEPPSNNLIAIDRDLVVNSRGVSVVATQEPAQPLATLYSFFTTSFRDLRK